LSTLQITLSSPYDQGVAVELRDETWQVTRFVLRANQIAEREVEPGSYVLQVEVPGHPVLQHVKVGEGVTTIEVNAPASPHEWLAREAMLGLVNLSDYFANPPLDAFPDVWVRVWVRTPSGWVIVPDAVRLVERDSVAAKIDVPAVILAGGRTAFMQWGGTNLPWSCVALPPKAAASAWPEAYVIAHTRIGAESGGPQLLLDPSTASGDADMLLRYLAQGQLEQADAIGVPIVNYAQTGANEIQRQAKEIQRLHGLQRIGRTGQRLSGCPRPVQYPTREFKLTTRSGSRRWS
jgi:hypothetical protein